MTRWQKKRPGDTLRIPAGVYNALLDILNARGNYLSLTTPANPTHTKIKVANATGATLQRFSIVQIAEPLISPTQNLHDFLTNPTFHATSPTGADCRIAITQEPLAPGAIGWAVCAGITHAYITGPQHNFGRPTPSHTDALETADAGPITILWQESGEGHRRAIIRIGQCGPIIARLRTLDTLYPCQTTPALLLIADDNTTPCEGHTTVTLRDSLGIAERALPPDTFAWAVLLPANETFDLIHYGKGCCAQPSQSDISHSDPSTSSTLSDHSTSSTSEPSTPSDHSDAPPSQSISLGSDKSTAIVPASWTPTGYAALFIHEMPEVRFDDIVIATVPMHDHDIALDPHFVEVCATGTIEVCGISVDKPVQLGARVHGNHIRLKWGTQDPTHAARVVIRITGIRRGFTGHRFPPRTKEQFEANERFINSAYPAR